MEMERTYTRPRYSRSFNTPEGGRDEVRYRHYRFIGEIGKSNNGWIREVNIIAWNNGNPGLDIRSWKPDHSKMSRGVNLPYPEVQNLKELLNNLDWEPEQEAEHDVIPDRYSGADSLELPEPVPTEVF